MKFVLILCLLISTIFAARIMTSKEEHSTEIRINGIKGDGRWVSTGIFTKSKIMSPNKDRGETTKWEFSNIYDTGILSNIMRPNFSNACPTQCFYLPYYFVTNAKAKLSYKNYGPHIIEFLWMHPGTGKSFNTRLTYKLVGQPDPTEILEVVNAINQNHFIAKAYFDEIKQNTLDSASKAYVSYKNLKEAVNLADYKVKIENEKKALETQQATEGKNLDSISTEVTAKRNELSGLETQMDLITNSKTTRENQINSLKATQKELQMFITVQKVDKSAFTQKKDQAKTQLENTINLLLQDIDEAELISEINSFKENVLKGEIAKANSSINKIYPFAF
jgi:hypothetical protein